MLEEVLQSGNAGGLSKLERRQGNGRLPREPAFLFYPSKIRFEPKAPRITSESIPIVLSCHAFGNLLQQQETNPSGFVEENLILLTQEKCKTL